VFFEAARGTTAFAGVAKTLVEKLKYSGRTEYAPVMARRMADVLRAEFPASELDALVPVPLHPTRQRERGFNQSCVLAEWIGREVGLPVHERLLRRVRVTQSQTRLSRRERACNIQEAFAAGALEYVSERSLVLVDDVCTTGATLNECARVLKQAGARRIYCLTFARATFAS
jgi:ComF family protein